MNIGDKCGIIYTVTAKFVECEPNVSVARNIMRELETGRIINSGVVLSFGTKPLEVYKELAGMKNTAGEFYGLTELKNKKQSEPLQNATALFI